MSLFDLFRYDGKRVVVVGAATGMGNAAARLLVDAGAEVVAMDYAPMDIDGIAGTDHGQPRRQGVDRRRGRRVRRPRGRAVLVRWCRRRHAGHREDQLPRSPPHDQPDARCRDARPRQCHRVHLVGRRCGLGPRRQHGGPRRVPRHRGHGRGLAVGDRQRQGRLLPEQARRLLVRRQQRLPAAQEGRADQRDHARARPTRRSPRPTRRCGSASGPTIARTPASRRRRRRIRPTRSCSCAATPPRRSPGSRSSSDQGYFSSGITNSYPRGEGHRRFPHRPLLIVLATAS